MLLLMFYLEENGKMPSQWSNWWCEGKYKEDPFSMHLLMFCHMMWKVGKKLGKYLTYVLKGELYCNTISINYVFQPYQIIDGRSYMITITYLLLAI